MVFEREFGLVLRSRQTNKVLTKVTAPLGQGSTEVLVSLEPEAGSGNLESGEWVTVAPIPSGTGHGVLTVSPSQFTLSAERTTQVMIVEARNFPTFLEVRDQEFSVLLEVMEVVRTSRLPVSVLCREAPVEVVREFRTGWFDSADRNEELSELRIQPGATIEVFAGLRSELDDAFLLSAESVRLSEIYFNYFISPGFELAVLEEGETGILFQIEIARDAPPSGSIVIGGRTGQPLSFVEDIPTRLVPPPPLPVRVTPRRFRVSLFHLGAEEVVSLTTNTNVAIGSILNSVIDVPQDIVAESAVVSLVISDTQPENLSITLFSPQGRRLDVVSFGTVSLNDTYELMLPLGTRSRGEWTLSIMDESVGNPGGRLESWGLEITGFRPGFAVSVIAGESVRLLAHLSGLESLAPGERVAVDLVYDGLGAAAPPVEFDSGTGDVEVVLTVATSGTLRAVVRDELVNAQIESADAVAIRVIEPASFSLAWLTAEDTPLSRVSVVANTTVSATLGMTVLERVRVGSDNTLRAVAGSAGLLIGDLQVGFSYVPPAAGRVEVVSPRQVALSADDMRVESVLRAAAAAESGTLTAMITDARGAQSIPAPASLAVEILPREFALVFTPSEIGIQPGTSQDVTLTLTNASLLSAAEAVAVQFGVPGTNPLSLMFSALDAERDPVN